jgi:hypothetical protein
LLALFMRKKYFRKIAGWLEAGSLERKAQNFRLFRGSG